MTNFGDILGGIGLGVNFISQMATNHANSVNAAAANQNNLRMMQYQNSYNNPVNQMARIRAAGLNPNLVYDKGVANMAASTYSGSKSAEYSAPQVNTSDIVQAHMMQKQTELLQAQINKTNAEANKVQNTTPEYSEFATMFKAQKENAMHESELSANKAVESDMRLSILSANREVFDNAILASLRSSIDKGDILDQQLVQATIKSDIMRALKETTIAQARAQLRLTQESFQKMVVGVSEMLQRIALMKKQGQLIDQKAVEQTLMNNIFKGSGIKPGSGGNFSPLYQIIGTLLNKLGINIGGE